MSDPTRSQPIPGGGAPRALPIAGLRALLAAMCLAIALAFSGQALAQTSQPRTVSFPSADGKTTLTGYLFAPAGRPKTAPAVVLMHGRSGAYSSFARGNYSSITIDKGIRNWADLWAAQGYWALVVDSFGPRGFPAGVEGGSDPPSTSAVSVRPLDAYGALRYLRASPRVKPDRIALQGWSDGGSAVLAAMSSQISALEGGHGFRVAVALYPGCGLDSHLKDGYAPYAPVRIFIGSKDGENSTAACERLVSAGRAKGGDIAIDVLEGATHGYDDAMRPRPAVPANATATAETRHRAIAFVAAALGH